MGHLTPGPRSGTLGAVRILVTALGAPGHAFPLVPLATALRDAGHDVTFAAGPDVLGGVATTGLAVLPSGGGLAEGFVVARERLGVATWPPDRATEWTLATEVFGDILPRRVVADLAPWLATHRPDLVVAEIGDQGAALAAAAAGVPCVLHGVGRRPPLQAPMYHRARGSVLALATELGLDLVEGAPLGHASLDPCPPSLQAPPEGDELAELPLRPTAWNPPVPGSSPPASGRPWAYLTLGTAMGTSGVLRTAAAALAGLDLDVLVAAGSIAIGELDGLATDRVRVEPFVAQADVLASDHPPVLVVHHGGSGTTLGAAAAGIPQLFLPQGADQFFNAAAVSAIGAGATVASPDGVAAAAGPLIAEGPARAAARALASEIAAMPSPSDVAAAVGAWGQPEM
ncbi:glycosyltransferase [Actinomycetospora sp. CA-101289]|uniref:glycosyltransferase n=1 Tax=Actinomycetospora sp. CA-101289 TaxID=3239893 RepID=UPI003D968141